MLEQSKRSLAFSTLFQMGMRITFVIIATAALSYLHIINNLEEQTLDKLKKYITERASKDSTIFQLAQDNHALLKRDFLSLWEKRKNANAKARFERLFTTPKDGTYRLDARYYTGIDRPFSSQSAYRGQIKNITGFVGRGTPIDDNAFQNRLLLALDLVDKYAQGWSNRFANTYISMPEGVNIVYWPGLPWALGAKSTLDIPNEEWVYIANKENDPKRKSVWTGLYYDQTANEWMVSCITPVDAKNGQHLINIGHDILLNNLFERVFNDHLEGAYNMIVRDDARLIAHPDKVPELEAALGLVNINKLNDPVLNTQFEQISAGLEKNGDQTFIIDDTTNDNFIAVAKLSGPDWLFVTVYPKKLLSTPALKAAEYIFFIGIVGLIIELVMLRYVLMRKVIRHINTFVQASRAISEGKYEVLDNDQIDLPTKRKDEIGILARTFQNMSTRLSEYRHHMEEKVQHRTAELEAQKIRAEHQAHNDSLTELPNRRAFFDFARLEVEKTKNNANSLAVIMLDIDRFKIINDRYGHAAGDEVIKNIGDLLKVTKRTSDLAARFGGEEFIIMLCDTSSEDALHLAEILRQTIETLPISYEGDIIHLTASFGISEFSNADKGVDDLIARAVKALNEAKEKGRNLVIMADK